MIRTGRTAMEHFTLCRARCQRSAPQDTQSIVLDIAALWLVGVPEYLIQGLTAWHQPGCVYAGKLLAERVQTEEENADGQQ